MYFSLESGESQLAATIDYLGAEHFVYASDVSSLGYRIPENLEYLRNHPDLSEDVKEKILLETREPCWTGLGPNTSSARS